MTDVKATEVKSRAAELGIALRDEWVETVRANLEISLRLGAEVAAFPLEDEVELAPVFSL